MMADPGTLARGRPPSRPLDAVALAEAVHAAGPALLLRQRLPRRQLPLLTSRERTAALARRQGEGGREASVAGALSGAYALLGGGVCRQVNRRRIAYIAASRKKRMCSMKNN